MIVELIRISANIATPIGLIGFACGLVALVYYWRLRQQRMLLEGLPPNKRAILVDEYLSRYKIDFKDLTPDKKIALLNREMDIRYGKFRLGIAVGAITFFSCLLIVVVTIPYNGKFVDVQLIENGLPLSIDFDLVYYLSERGPVSVSGQKGRAVLRDIPHKLHELQIVDVSCVGGGYSTVMAPDHRYPLKDGILLKIEMQPDATKDPIDLMGIPDPAQDMPPDNELAKPPQVPAEQVRVRIENRTGRPLYLVLYNCTPLPAAPDDFLGSQYLSIPFRQHQPVQWIEDLRHGSSGWYIFFVRTLDAKYYRLGRYNVFNEETPKFAIVRTGNAFSLKRE